MRPATLREACTRAQSGEPWPKAMGDFLQAFYSAENTAIRVDVLADSPNPFSDARFDALAEGVAEYLYKRWTRRDPPSWMGERDRYLAEPWFVTDAEHPSILEYLTWVSPPEFKSRNIMTDEAPLRRATKDKPGAP